MNAECRTFRANSWDEAVTEAREFVNELLARTGSPATVLSISHVSEDPYAVVFVWYVA